MGLFVTLEDRELGSRRSKVEMGLSLWVKAMIFYQVTGQKVYPSRYTGLHLGVWVYIFHGRPNSRLFGAATSVKKCLSFSPFPNRGHFCSANVCWVSALGKSWAGCTRTSNAWSLPSEAESLRAFRPLKIQFHVC